MNKLVAVLGIAIILLGSVCGVLFYQISDLQNQNSNLQNQIGQLENQVGDLESQLDNVTLENIELQNQTRELEDYLSKISDARQVEITKVTMSYAKSTPSSVSVTVKNVGSSDVDGLNLTLKTSSEGEPFMTMSIERIPAEEEKIIFGSISKGLLDESNTILATLMLNDIILDTDRLQWR